MQHIYDVQLSSGQTHQVSTPHHHSDHSDDAWTKHVVDILKGIGINVAGASIVKILYRGKR